MPKKSKKEKLIRVCPKCGSKNIGINPKANIYICENCAFSSPLFPQISLRDAKKLKDAPAKFSPAVAPTKMFTSIPIILFYLTLATIIIILLIILR